VKAEAEDLSYLHPADVSSEDHDNLPRDATVPVVMCCSLVPVSLHILADQQVMAQTVMDHIPYYPTAEQFHSVVPLLLLL
jgi:hypothetical protein